MESELKHISGGRRKTRLRRKDRSLEAGRRARNLLEEEEIEREKDKRREPPIIQKIP